MVGFRGRRQAEPAARCCRHGVTAGAAPSRPFGPQTRPPAFLPWPPTARALSDLLKAVRAARKNIRIFGGDSLMDAQVAKAAGAANALGVRGSDVSFGSPEFVEAFNEFTKGKGIEYNAKAAHAYDAAVALMEAYRRAPQTKEGPAILAELANVRFQGKSGPIAFDEYGDLKYDPVSSYNVLEFDKAGGLRVLEA
jgi:branched-chain amino acid transport system substrate-binding protein